MHELVLNVFFKFEYEKKLRLNIYFLLKKKQVVFFFWFLLKSKTESLFSKSELCTHVRIIRVNITIGKPPNATMGFNPTGEFHYVIAHAYK